MKAHERAVKKSGLVLHLVASISPVLLFVLVLLLGIPPSYSRWLSAYSLPLFLLVIALYYLSFRLSSRFGWLGATALTMLLLAFSLGFLWNSGYSDDKIMGGLLPFRDALDYFNGAEWILNGQAIRTLNEGAAWRPLYPGFLASLLWITGRNLQWALALQVALAGLCFSVATVRIWSRLGAAAAALFASMLYFYIQPLIGTAYTETAGLALGCLAFVLLWDAAEKQQLLLLVSGIVVLMLAVSARAGAFLIFPALVLWAGWAWRGAGRFSLRHSAVTLAAVVGAYLIVNTLYGRLMVEPGGLPFGNFAWTLYGQVNGGAGYHKAFEDLAARNPEVIFRAAWRFFLAHPQGLLVGSLKAYRDFFSPVWGVFNFGLGLPDIALSAAATAVMLWGVYGAARRIVEPESSLLLAGLAGILFSVPFLPPIDGGIRIYASTMPFVYALPAVALGGRLSRARSWSQAPVAAPAGLLALGIAALMIPIPVALRHVTATRETPAPSCEPGQVAFAATASAGTYIDLVPDGAAACGRIPNVCLPAFETYASLNDPSDAAVFETLAETARASASVVRVFVGNDLILGRPHVYVVPPQGPQEQQSGVIAGCALEVSIKGRPSLYILQ